ncbi:MAG: hypothetical protein LUG47_08215 [Clostridiales bacterium]|nr:hypothetical protein [Clostridiales bacterium]
MTTGKRRASRLLSLILALAMCLSVLPVTAAAEDDETTTTTYTQVTSASDITDGDYVLVAASDGVYYALGTTIGSKIEPVSVSVSNGTVTADTDTDDLPVWTLAKTDDSVTLSNGSSYLAATSSSSTNFKSSSDADYWTVNTGTTSGTFYFTNATSTTRGIAYGTASNQLKFGAYSTTNYGSSSYVFDLLVFKADTGSSGGSTTDPTETVETPSLTYSETDKTVTFKCATSGVTYYYSYSESGDYTALDGDSLDVSDHIGETLYAYAELDGSKSETTSVELTESSSGGDEGDETDENVSTIAEVKAEADTSVTYTVDGTVTYISNKSVYVQDETGGICLFFSTAPSDISLGDDVRASGTYYVYKDLVELTGVTDYTVIGSTSELPSQTVTIAELSSDYSDSKALQSTRVYLTGLTEGTVGTSTTLTDADGNSIVAYGASSVLTEAGATEGSVISLYAVVSDYSGYQLYVAQASDITVTSTGGGDEEETGTLTSGSYVIWAPAYNMALSSTMTGSYYAGVTVTESESGKMSGYGDTELWTVTVNSDGTLTLKQGDSYLGVVASGSYYNLSVGGTSSLYSYTWTVVDAGDGLYYLKDTTSGVYVEWYSKFSDWSTYSSVISGSEGMFALKFSPVSADDYTVDTSIVEAIASWGGGGPYTDDNASAINGDKYNVGDMLDTGAVFTVVAKGVAAQPYQTTTSGTGGTNYYMGGTSIGASEGDYMQFAVSTAGWGDMELSFRMRATDAAPGSFQLQYSTDGGETFENFTTGTYSYAYTGYSSGESYTVSGSGSITDGVAKTSLAAKNYVTFTFDVPEGAENADNLLIRLVAGTSRADGGSGSISGNIRIDSVVLSGSPIVADSITGYVSVTPDNTEDQAVGTELTLTSSTEGATIYYRFVDTATGEGTWLTYNESSKPTLDSLPSTLEVYATSEGRTDSVTRIL